MEIVKRPILRYHGGKFLLAPWIISHFPKHQVYVEPFGGAASVLLLKNRSYAEIYNDIDDEVVNLFQVARDLGEQLVQKMLLTPFSRVEFNSSYQATDDPIERARRTIIRSFMGFGSGIQSQSKTGFRSNSNRSGTTPAHDWNNLPECYRDIISRLKGVIIENRNALEVMNQHDSANTLIYLDPPYKLSTRFNGEKTSVYKHEMTDEQHLELLKGTLNLTSMVIFSGYDNDLYNDTLLPNGYFKVNKSAFADGAKKRIETLWISNNAKTSLSLFS